ncbi:hypothetical protein L915_02098, partial [Phytophthora nicotianae]
MKTSLEAVDENDTKGIANHKDSLWLMILEQSHVLKESSRRTFFFKYK